MGDISMTEKKRRDKVVAEITLAYLARIAEEMGRPLSEEQALEFLNQEGRAYAMWTRMMQAGEDYIKATLQKQRHPMIASRPGNQRRMVI